MVGDQPAPGGRRSHPVDGRSPRPGPRPTSRQRRGERGEMLAAEHLASIGWRVLARRVRSGRNELDIIAVDPGPPAVLVAVEVRLRSSSLFGTPEESVDRRKIARLYRAMSTLVTAGALPDGAALPRLRWRVDLIAIDDAPLIAHGVGGPAIRHLRSLEPG
jgi:putative endonuclease